MINQEVNKFFVDKPKTFIHTTHKYYVQINNNERGDGAKL
jgi:hypothetical protein